MASNITFTSRNVLSKKMMGGDATKGLDNINLFCILTIMSFLILTPIAMMVEGVRLTPAALTAMNLDPLMIFQRLCFTALCFHGYQQTSYLVLGQVSFSPRECSAAWKSGETAWLSDLPSFGGQRAC